MNNMQGRTVFITGGSRGIGRAIALKAAQAGANVVIAAKTEVETTKLTGTIYSVAEEIEAAGGKALPLLLDVRDEQQIHTAIQQAAKAFGGIDVLINNAGKSAQALLSEVKDLSWYEDLMRVNFWGSVWCTHAALPYLKQSRGSIVAVSSLAGLVGVPGRNAYSATKFAMNGFFEALRAEMKESGVSVTIAYPGVVATEIRYRGYNADGAAAGSSGLKEDDAMSVQECADLIIRGMEKRQRDVVMGVKGKLGRWLKLLFPSLVERMALAALKQEVRPH